GRDLLLRRRPAVRRGEGGAGVGEVASAAAHRAGGPVDAAQLVDNGAADAGGGIAGEGNAARSVIRVARLHECSEARGRQVVAVHVGGDSAQRLADDVAHEAHVGADEFVGLGGGGTQVSHVEDLVAPAKRLSGVQAEVARPPYEVVVNLGSLTNFSRNLKGIRCENASGRPGPKPMLSPDRLWSGACAPLT